ncbi:MAG: DUF3298 and DUF4163 domain-containing protein [Desulfovibrio sp.]|jgi:hypothetical protein|nr:DUF3298 and DUF4163 domain-containing protein [Desulfovibrio sp.]
MPREKCFVAVQIRTWGMGFLSCVLAAVLIDLLTWSRPEAVPVLTLAGQMDPAKKADNALEVIDHAVQRTQKHGRLVVDVSFNYPSLGAKPVDSDIERWVTSLVRAFEEEVGAEHLNESDVEDMPESALNYALHGAYSVSRPSEDTVSLTFELWTYTGGVHGNLDVITLNYSLLSGQRLVLADLFEDPDAALGLMSAWSLQILSRRFAGEWDQDMLRNGASPEVENFAALTLTRDGIVIHFQPYQVAPWAAGAQEVEMPLEKLADARPLMAIWGR